MKKYIIKRIFTGLLVVIFSVVFTFVIVRLAPGDPIKIMAGLDNPNPDMIATLQEKYGLNKPIIEQLWLYVKNILHGDLGYSYLNQRSVLALISERLIPTFSLALTGALAALGIGTFVGVYAARKQGSLIDRVVCSISYFCDSLPSFWLSLMLILLFSSTLKWLPTSGMYNLRASYMGFDRFLDILKHMILPVATLIIVQFPYYFRIARSSALQTMSEDFIVTFRATGMSEKKIFNKYVLRNAIIPTITVFGISLAYMITGVALIEIVFAWPGMGRLMLDAISRRDYMVLSGIYLVLAISVASMMIIVDVIYGIIDPRIRYD